jgi:hypothetical protein
MFMVFKFIVEFRIILHSNYYSIRIKLIYLLEIKDVNYIIMVTMYKYPII